MACSSCSGGNRLRLSKTANKLTAGMKLTSSQVTEKLNFNVIKRFLTQNDSPIGGWRFIDPDNGFHYDLKYTTYEELEAHILQVRKANSLRPIAHLRTVVENYLCQEPGMEPRCCPDVEGSRRFLSYWNGGKLWIKTAAKQLVGLNPFVTSEEALARATICVKCPYNKAPKQSHPTSDALMELVTIGRTTPLDDKLFNCSICTCTLKAKVHYNKKDIHLDPAWKDNLPNDNVPNLEEKPFKCWQLND